MADGCSTGARGFPVVVCQTAASPAPTLCTKLFGKENNGIGCFWERESGKEELKMGAIQVI